jgi:UDP:flavonoid glycosyltransferase YjiC (YdhE family)
MKKAAFFCDAIGQALNCVAIAQQLKKYGIHCIFIADASFEGMFAKYGFEEYLIDVHGASEEQTASHVWANHVKQGEAIFRLPTIDHIEPYIVPYYEAIVDSAIHAQEPLQMALRAIKPDIICVDDVVMYPAIKHYGCPWVRIVSCAETEIPDVSIPPHLSGYSIYEPEKWERFRKTFSNALRKTQDRYNAFLAKYHEGPYPVGIFLEPSPYLNFLIYPKAIAYDRYHFLPPEQFIYLNGCVRQEFPYQLPRFACCPTWPLIYVGYGSMGSEKTLLEKQIAMLASSPVRILVSVPENFERPTTIPKNVRMETFVPQPSVMPQVDIVVHHGGNNTFNETLFFGKPSIILPFAWDGFDNAMRLQDLNLGIHLHRYTEGITHLESAIMGLLQNKPLQKRLQSLSQEMQKLPGAVCAAERVFELIKGKSNER